MNEMSKERGARHTSSVQTEYGSINNITVSILQQLRDITLENSIKYRWDPAIGRCHTEYLNLLNGILRDYEE